ncbi:MAG: STAS domain-containing protein [Anaerolineales bacterium]|nr:STAS domain-containing protein [Anaerolineales bacterium]
MTTTNEQLGVRVLTEDVYAIDIGEELVSAVESAIWAAYSQAIDGGAKWILLNFSATKYINSGGIGLVTLLLIQTHKDGLQLCAVGLSKHYFHVFEITQLDRMIRLFPTETEALLYTQDPDAAEDQEMTHQTIQEQVLQSIPQDLRPDARIDSNWAKPIDRLKTKDFPTEALNLNVDERRLVGPFQGFGQLWHKRFNIRLVDLNLSPPEVIEIWKQNLPRFKPSEKRFYPSPSGIQPGEIILINAKTPGGPISTGVMVLYSGEESFTLITPEGHPESGWVTFSAYKDGSNTVLQVDVLARASDPLYEAAFRLAGSKVQDRIWTHVLTSLATHLNTQGEVQVTRKLLDPKVQWRKAGNIRYNAQIRTIIHLSFAPIRWIKNSSRRTMEKTDKG